MPVTSCLECHLRSTSICQILGADDAADVEAVRSRQYSLPAKRLVMREGEAPNEVFRVHAGWGARFRVLANGSRQVLSFVLPGDFLTLELLNDAPIRFSILTLTRMTLCAFPRERIARELFADPEKSALVARRWACHVSDLERSVMMLGRMPAAGRVAGLMLDIHKRLNERGMTAHDEFAFPPRHEDLADALGLTPAHVSRTLTVLRQDRLLEIRAARAHILDREGLQKLTS